MAEKTMAGKLEVGDTVVLDGVEFKVKYAPFGSGRLIDGKIAQEEVTLTLTREPILTDLRTVDGRVGSRAKEVAS